MFNLATRRITALEAEVKALAKEVTELRHGSVMYVDLPMHTLRHPLSRPYVRCPTSEVVRELLKTHGLRVIRSPGNSPSSIAIEPIPAAPTPHKHAALIKAWADGASIEWRTPVGAWLPAKLPSWDYVIQYRIAK